MCHPVWQLELGCPPLVTATNALFFPVEHSLWAQVAGIAHRLHFGDEPVGELVPPVEGHPPLAVRSEPLLEALRNVLHSNVVVLWLVNGRVRILTRFMNSQISFHFFLQFIMEIALSIDQ